MRCRICGKQATGTLFEAGHIGHVVDATPMCEEHGEQWDGTSVHGRHECWFDRSVIHADFAAWWAEKSRQEDEDEEWQQILANDPELARIMAD